MLLKMSCIDLKFELTIFHSYGDVTIADDGLFTPVPDGQDLWAGRDLNRAKPAVTWCLGFSGLI
jgi:hypothetical protein